MLGVITAIVKVFHVILCFGLVFFVLIQSSKGGGLSGAFGTGAETFFGYSQANKKIRMITTACAVLFFITALTMGILPAHTSKQKSSLMTNIPVEQPAEQPVQQP